MPRLFPSVIPVCVAATALVLASTPVRAQQAHDHGGGAAGQHACACCGNSSGGAMNHAAGSGAAAQSGKAAEDHTAHQAAKPAEDHSAHQQAQQAQDHSAHQGGNAPAGKGAMPMDHSMGGCPMMDMDHGANGQAMDHGGSAGCCADMKKDGAQAEAKPMNGAAGCCGGSMAMGKGEGGAPAMAMGDASKMGDMQVMHFLFDNRADISRTVKMLPNGVDAVTESDKPDIAAQIKTHVAAMYARLKDGARIRQHDPLFDELFEHADQIDANITYTDKGIRVVETSTDPAVAHLLHKHAEAVDGFIKNGMADMMKEHPVK